MKDGFLWGSVGAPVHTLHSSGYWLHSSHGKERAVGIGMCLLAAFWEEILCFWCMRGRIWSSRARLFELKRRAQAQQYSG